MIYWLIIFFGIIAFSLSISNPVYYLAIKQYIKKNIYFHIFLRVLFFVIGFILVFLGLFYESKF